MKEEHEELQLKFPTMIEETLPSISELELIQERWLVEAKIVHAKVVKKYEMIDIGDEIKIPTLDKFANIN